MRAVVYIAVGAALLVAGAAEAQTRHVRHNAASGHARQIHVERGPMVESRVQTWYSDSGWQGGYGPVEAYGYGYGYGGAGQRPPVVIAQPEPMRHGGYAYGAATRSMPYGYVVDGYGRYPWARGGHDQGCRCGPPPQPAYYRPEPAYVTQPPIYVSQPPVYVEAPPVYVRPAPVYVEPARVHVAPPPVYVAPAEVRVAPAQVEVARPQVHVEPPRVEAAPPVVSFEHGYYAMPDAPPPPPPPHRRSPTERPYMQEPGERG